MCCFEVKYKCLENTPLFSGLSASVTGKKKYEKGWEKGEICAERERKKEHGSGMVKFVQQEIK